MCHQQYFIEYILGHRQIVGIAADKGTIVHKVLEICAACKKAFQDGEEYIEDEIVGKLHTHKYEPEYLNNIIDIVYNYYSSAITHHNWTLKHYQDCVNWSWQALKYNNGMFDPRTRLVVAPEIQFDFEIQEDWSHYRYDTEDGIIEGNLALKGTIDLITELDPTCYEMIDWKTGQRKDWATDHIKNEALLYKDPQLRMYHYAMIHLFPNIKRFLITIFFIKDGGPYTLLFEEKDIETTLAMIRKRYEYIQQTTIPRLNKSWKCNRLCHYGKNSFEDTDIEPLIEERPYQVTRQGQYMLMCEQVKYMTQREGIEWVCGNMKKPGFSLTAYKSPGEVE
jgi:hypothetical protein